MGSGVGAFYREVYAVKAQPEYQLQVAVCDYLRIAYPDVLFLSIAACKLTIPQGARNKKIQKPGFKCPDLLILEPRNGYAGLMIELKTASPYKRDGTIKTDEHLQGQAATLGQLEVKGYRAAFAWSFEQARMLIDGYMYRTKTD